MKEYYKIGEISNLYGIGTDSLRYYEEIGIIKPKRDVNGYRMYSIGDIRTLNVLRELRAIGFPMNEIKEHLQNFNTEKTLDLFKKEMDAIDDKLTRLSRLKDKLKFRISAMEHNIAVAPADGTIETLHLKPRKIISLNDNVFRDEDFDFLLKKLQKKTENSINLIGNDHIGAFIARDFIETGNYGYFQSVFCQTDDDETFDEIIPAGDYLTMTVTGSYDKVPDSWRRLFDEIKERRLTVDSAPIELYIIDNHVTKAESEYLTLLQVKVI